MKDLKQKPGHPPLNRIPIFDHKGNMRGHVGRTATDATVSRFLGRPGAKLGKKEGRTAWIGDKPPPPPPPPPKPNQADPTAVAVAAQNSQGKLAIAEHQSQAKHKLAIELNKSKAARKP